MSVLAVYEMVGCIKERGNLWLTFPFYFVAVAAPLTARLFTSVSAFLLTYASIAFCILLYLFGAAVFSRDKDMLNRIAILYMTCVYITTGFTSIVLLRDMPMGKYIYVLSIAAPWVSDIFAYFCGYFFGRHKLIPEISPKKTVEGAVGAVVFTSLGMLAYGEIIGRIFPDVTPAYVTLAIGGVLISVMAQLGDLAASLIKRRYEVKDYGTILPGHGGIMDRFDSVIPTAAMLLMYVSIPYFSALFK